MSVVTFQTGGDFRSLMRHYERKRKDDLIRAVQDLQQTLGDLEDPADYLGRYTKDTLAYKAAKLHARFPESDDGT